MISAAVFKNFPRCRDEVGQDWRLWIDRGYLDFVCPMDYTGSDAEFESLVRGSRAIRGSVCSSIGARLTRSGRSRSHAVLTPAGS